MAYSEPLLSIMTCVTLQPLRATSNCLSLRTVDSNVSLMRINEMIANLF